MTQEHPITLPEELVDQWSEAWIDAKVKHEGRVTFIATQAARWGADQEFEACCHEVQKLYGVGRWLRSIRRPKPPSLKEQALLQLDTLNADLAMHGMGCDLSQIRRALEQLND